MLRPVTKRAAGCAAWLALIGLTACSKQPPLESGQTLAPVTIRVATVESRPRTATEEIIGSIRAKLHARVEAKVSGRIQRMLVVPGQIVKAGELLAELDVRENKARLDQAEAVREQAEQELRRAMNLLKEKTISQQEFDLIQSRERVAVATVAETETMLGYSRIVAPFEGMITRKLADVGDLAAPGKLLLELEDPSALRLEADVPEALLDQIQMGARCPIRIPTLTNLLEGTTTEITPVADPSTRTFLVKFDLHAASALRVGQFGRVLLPVGAGAALRVPASAVVQRGQMELVFVVSDKRAQLRLVKTGKRIGDEIEVVSGIEARELVAIEPVDTLRDGQPVVLR